MVVQHNLSAMNSNRQLGISTGLQAKSSEKLSSGYRINRAADDAAGLAISEKMRRQIRGLDQATDNIQDGISLVQIADGALAESLDNMQRVNELAIKAATETLTDADRSYIQEEVKQLLKEVDRTAQTTSFNDKIFPLNGDPITTKVPDAIRENPFTIINDGPGNLTVDGTVYPAGSTIVIPNVLSIMKENDINTFVNADIFFGGAGICSENPHHVAYTDDAIVSYGTADDLRVDEDGYIYAVPVSTYPFREVRFYVGRGQFLSEEPPYNHDPYCFKAEKVQEETEPLLVLAGNEADQVIDIEMVNATSEGLGVGSIDLSTAASAREAIDKVKKAIAKIAEYRSNFGAKQNRLEHAYNNVNNAVENTQHAESIIRDTDMATEMVRYSNNNILMQAGQSMLAQANQTNQGVMALLQ